MIFRIAAIVPLGLAACTQLDPLPLGAEGPASASVHSHAPAAPVVSYGGYRVTEPADWRGVNDARAGS